MPLEIFKQELNQKLPSPKGVALAIMEACHRDEVTAAEIAKLVQTDPALFGRLLMRANATSNGLRSVMSAIEAVHRLGLNTVRQLALSFSLVDQHSSGSCKQFDYEGFWSHSLLMALAMQEIGRHQHIGAPDDLFTCGLLSQVGRLALATAYPQEYGSLLAQELSRENQLPQERELLTVDHLQLTTALMEQWGIPATLITPVGFHEDPTASHLAQGSRARLLCDTLHLALKIADFALVSEPVQATLRPELMALAAHAQLDAPDFTDLLAGVVAQWKNMGGTLKIQTPDLDWFVNPAPAADTTAPVLANVQLRVLLVEDDDDARRLMQIWVAKQPDCSVRVACDGQEALKIALEFTPHVVVTDWRMPVMDGLALCKALRSSDWGRKIYILMVTGAGEEDELVKAFEAGVDDYLVRPVNMRVLLARLKGAGRYVQIRESWERDHAQLTQMAAELTLSNKRLQLASLTDPLTELANRRAGMHALSQAWSTSTRRGTALAVISVDIDHFKLINDSYGHALGDVVLKLTAAALRRSSRTEDTVCRWGGEEFLVISPNVNESDALQTAERLRIAIESNPIAVNDRTIAVTVSLGVACWQSGMPSMETLLSNADMALYAAKAAGRNRAVVHTDKLSASS